MIIQINELFINADNIVTISPYDAKDQQQEKTYFGLIINGVKYLLFACDSKDETDVVNTNKKVLNIVTTIINSISVHPVQRLNIAEKQEVVAETVKEPVVEAAQPVQEG